MLEIVALLALIIVLGYFSEILFDKTNVPDIFILLLLGLALGPLGVSQSLPGLATLTPGFLAPLASLVAVLTLVVILFDAGLDVNLQELLKSAPFAFKGTVINFFFTTATCFAALFLAGWDWLHALIVAVLIADTAEEVVFSLLQKVKVRPWVKSLLIFEGAFTSTLIGIFTVLIVSVFVQAGSSGPVTLDNLGSSFLGSISIALVLGAGVSYLWVQMLVTKRISSHRYLLSLAMAMILYVVVEAFHAHGVIAVLIFGVALGLSKEKLEKSLFEFHREITFLVRSFFFVYLGFIISFDNLSISAITVSLLAVGAMLAGRLVGLQYIAKAQSPTKPEFVLLAGALPAGLATAVFATVLQRYGVVIPGLSEFIFLVIFESVLLSMICTFYYARNQPSFDVKKPVIVSKTPG
ncbi:MAG: cation:proton antiporter [Candidatus Norongarragalinales archaeon]